MTMPTRDPDTPDRELVHPEASVAPGYLANHAARVFNRIVDDALRQHGLSLALLAPVLLLSWKGPMRQRDLVAAAAVKQPAMVALLGKLEVMGLISRTPAPDDRRAAIVSLTAHGANMAEIGGDALRQANAKGLGGYSEEEQRMLVALLQRFIKGLDGT